MNKATIRLHWFETALCVAGPIFFGLLSLYRGQDANWDLRNYHLYNPYALLTGRLSVDLAAAQLQSYFNPLLDLPYYLAQGSFPPKLIGFVLGAFHGLCFIWVMLIVRWVMPIDTKYTASLIALAGMCGAAFLGELGTTMGGAVTALLILISMWLLISRLDFIASGGARAIVILVVAGFVSGLASGLKLVNAPYAVGACVALLTLPISGARKLACILVFGVAVLAGIAMTFAYWGLMLYREFGNPLFPQYNNIFHGPLAQPIGAADGRWSVEGIWDALLMPFTMVIDGQRLSELAIRPLVWSVAYILLILSAIKGVRMRFVQSGLSARQLYFLCFFVMSFAGWLGIFAYYRYVMPIELLAPLLCWVLARYLFGTSTLTHGVTALMGACALLSAANIVDWGHAKWAEQSYRVTPPEIERPESAVILKLGGEPTAWIFPAFPQEAPIFGVATNLAVSAAYEERVAKVLKDRAGAVYAVLDPTEFDQPGLPLAAAVRGYGLTLRPTQCRRYDAYIGGQNLGYILCRLSR